MKFIIHFEFSFNIHNLFIINNLILGGVLGVMVGCLTLLILKFSPLTMDELKEWQSQSQSNRDAYVFT